MRSTHLLQLQQVETKYLNGLYHLKTKTGRDRGGEREGGRERDRGREREGEKEEEEEERKGEKGRDGIRKRVIE